jgi:hypothetical protein
MTSRGRIAKMFVLTVLALAFASGLALARAEPPRVVRGEVLAVHEATQTGEEGSFREITIRTRQQERIRLRLGPATEAPCDCRVGDPVRARVMAGGPGESALRVRALKNERTGKMTRIRSADGVLLQARDRQRDRLRDGSAEPSPERLRTRQRDGSARSRGGRGGRG